MSAPFRECDHNCTPTIHNLRGDARHYLDCPVWLKVGVNTSAVRVPAQRRAPGRPQITGGDGPGQRARAATPVAHTRPLYAGMALVTGGCVLGVVAIVVLLFGVLLGWWG